MSDFLNEKAEHDDDTVIYDDNGVENNFEKLLSLLCPDLAAGSKIVQSEQHEEEIAMLTNLKKKNGKHSENFFNTINKPAHGNEVHRIQSVINHSFAQSLTDNRYSHRQIEAVNKRTSYYIALNKNVRPLLAKKSLIKTLEIIIVHSWKRTNAASVISNTIGHVNHLPPEANSITSHNLTTRTATSAFFPDSFINCNQYSITTIIHRQLFYPAKSNTYMRRSNREAQRKLNVSDIRALKNLQIIQNSPLFSTDTRNSAANLERSIPHFEFRRNLTQVPITTCQLKYLALLQPASDNNGQRLKSYNGSASWRSSISYGEYTHRKAEEPKKT
uniref:Uncharacterized protein n=1 Tax=Glossina pallidipes TaxID=7398 RepID=A0A1A9ZKY9_GLOPL